VSSLNPFHWGLCKVFARKVIHPVGSWSEITAQIRNEARVIKKLQGDVSLNVIKIFQHGWLVENRFYFIDMEFCVFSLRDFLRAEAKVAMGEVFLECPHNESGGIACLTMWSIIKQITQGLIFIHSRKEVHRDLKPENGKLTCRNPLNGVISVVLS
jgi:serine/threonine protein kinase